jgi:integrase/recombinase XerD
MKALAAGVVPVEYAVAVDRYLSEAELGAASRRVYRISLAGSAWPLVGKLPPAGTSRRRAAPPIVPLAALDDQDAGRRIADAVAHRIVQAEVRTVNRELSALRSAIGWWQRRQWIGTDPTAALSQVGARPVPLGPLTAVQLAELFRVPAGLREQAFWHLLADTAAPAEFVLKLDAHGLDLGARRSRSSRSSRSSGAGQLDWSARTSDLLGWLLAGRRAGPVFLTDRRAPAGTPGTEICPLSGRGRMSYRRAAEIFTAHTRELDPEGRGWTLHQLRRPAVS